MLCNSDATDAESPSEAYFLVKRHDTAASQTRREEINDNIEDGQSF
jgi:hypothetical protein